MKTQPAAARFIAPLLCGTLIQENVEPPARQVKISIFMQVRLQFGHHSPIQVSISALKGLDNLNPYEVRGRHMIPKSKSPEGAKPLL